jgi:hypothetical protein
MLIFRKINETTILSVRQPYTREIAGPIDCIGLYILLLMFLWHQGAKP